MNLTSAEIGERVRILRKERGWTLHELGRRSGVSLSAVSKIENAQVAPTFDTLVKLADGFGLTFDTLLSQTSAAAPARGGGRLTITRKSDAVGFSTAAYDYEVHANSLRRKFMTPLIMAVKARKTTDLALWSSHPGEEFGFVIKGRVALHTEFYEPMMLETGDSAYFDSGMAHIFVSIGRGAALMASICYSNAIDRSGLAAAGVVDGDAASRDPSTMRLVNRDH